MSIEYTIDIQLTELGFPEIVPRNTPGRETSSRSISASQKQKVQPADAANETSNDAAAARCKAAHPPKSAQVEQVKGKTGVSTAGTGNTTVPTTGQGDGGGGAEADEGSDDSDVCEEEEIDDSGMLIKFTLYAIEIFIETVTENTFLFASSMSKTPYHMIPFLRLSL